MSTPLSSWLLIRLARLLWLLWLLDLIHYLDAGQYLFSEVLEGIVSDGLLRQRVSVSRLVLVVARSLVVDVTTWCLVL